MFREESLKSIGGVDVNSGTKEVPKVRSRLVGQGFARGERRDDLRAPTPPLAAAW